jgi:hypothetical protein
MDDTKALLRHTLATVAYRGGKALTGAPAGFAEFSIAPGSRTPAEILAHIGDLFEWALSLADGQHVWSDSKPRPWDEEVARFFAALRRFDERLAGNVPLGCPARKLFQGPIADALTHVGQIGMLRRLAGAPVRGENYYKADIEAGRIGPAQPSRRVELD